MCPPHTPPTVCLSVYEQDNWESCRWIYMKFVEWTEWLDYGPENMQFIKI